MVSISIFPSMFLTGGCHLISFLDHCTILTDNVAQIAPFLSTPLTLEKVAP